MLVNLFEGKWGLDDSCAGCFRATLGAVGGLRSSVSLRRLGLQTMALRNANASKLDSCDFSDPDTSWVCQWLW